MSSDHDGYFTPFHTYFRPSHLPVQVQIPRSMWATSNPETKLKWCAHRCEPIPHVLSFALFYLLFVTPASGKLATRGLHPAMGRSWPLWGCGPAGGGRDAAAAMCLFGQAHAAQQAAGS